MAAEAAADFFREKLGEKQHPPSSSVGDYPAKRTGSLKASVASTKAKKLDEDTFGARFGILRDVLIRNGRFAPKESAKKNRRGELKVPTLYARYLESPRTPKNPGGGRKMARDAWKEALETGVISAAIEKALKKYRNADKRRAAVAAMRDSWKMARGDKK